MHEQKQLFIHANLKLKILRWYYVLFVNNKIYVCIFLSAYVSAL